MSPVIIAIDPSYPSREAIDLGGLLARLWGAPPLVAAVDADERAASMLEELTAQLPEPEVAVLRERSAAQALHDLAVARRARAIVLGPARHGGLAALLGSVTGRLLHGGAPCAVAIAPRNWRLPDVRRVGVAFADTPEGMHALGAAEQLARAAGATLWLVTVVEPHRSAAVPTGIGAGDPGYGRAARERRHLASIAAKLSVPVEYDVLAGDTGRALVDASVDCDLLVCGSRGYGPLGTVLLGGVSQRLARNALCPVLIVPREPLVAADAYRDIAASART